jgi:ABC-type transport system involved in multi-copper enzyme maturation permease subunit
MVALLAKSSAAGISVGAAVLFLEGQILMLISAADGLPRAGQTLLTMGGSAPQDPGLPGPWQAVGVLAAYTVVFTAIAFWRFGRRDVTIG